MFCASIWFRFTFVVFLAYISAGVLFETRNAGGGAWGWALQWLALVRPNIGGAAMVDSAGGICKSFIKQFINGVFLVLIDRWYLCLSVFRSEKETVCRYVVVLSLHFGWKRNSWIFYFSEKSNKTWKKWSAVCIINKSMVIEKIIDLCFISSLWHYIKTFFFSSSSSSSVFYGSGDTASRLAIWRLLAWIKVSLGNTLNPKLFLMRGSRYHQCMNVLIIVSRFG